MYAPSTHRLGLYFRDDMKNMKKESNRNVENS